MLSLQLCVPYKHPGSWLRTSVHMNIATLRTSHRDSSKAERSWTLTAWQALYHVGLVRERVRLCRRNLAALWGRRSPCTSGMGSRWCPQEKVQLQLWTMSPREMRQSLPSLLQASYRASSALQQWGRVRKNALMSVIELAQGRIPASWQMVCLQVCRSLSYFSW